MLLKFDKCQKPIGYKEELLLNFKKSSHDSILKLKSYN